MNYKEFQKNIIDMVKEGQAKIGYAKGELRLYYPLESLNRLLEVDYSEMQLQQALEKSIADECSLPGGFTVSHKGQRFCVEVSADCVEYIHKNILDSPFLIEFIEIIQKHNLTITDIENVFKKYGDDVIRIDMSDEDFDFALYFRGAVPDEYIYCIKDEGVHLTYHRFNRKDYEIMFGELR